MKNQTGEGYYRKIIILLIFILSLNDIFAGEASTDLEYIRIDPVIVTNYQKKSLKKPGFIQIQAQLTVKDKISADKLEKHMPLVRDFIIDFLSFTDEKIIKDVRKRKQLRISMTKGIQKTLTKHVGEPLIEELVITHFMWN